MNKVVIPIEDRDFQTTYYFVCMVQEQEKFRELITCLKEKRYRTESL